MPKPKEEKTEDKAPEKTDKPTEAPAEGVLPPESSIVSEDKFTSPSGQQYRILHTNETDAYDTPEPPKRKRRTGGAAKK